MHDLQDPQTQLDYEAGCSPEVRGQECIACRRLWTFKSGMYNRNSAMKYGYELMCISCKATPKMSTAEWVAYLAESNYNSEGTKRQRHHYQGEMRKDRKGRAMDCQLFLTKLLHICPSLYVTQGGVAGDLALFVTGPERRDWDGKSFRYQGFVTLGMMPEFSSYEFDDDRDVMIRERERGWRQILLRFIEDGFVTEKQVDKEFGPPSGGVHSTWYQELRRIRTKAVIQ